MCVRETVSTRVCTHAPRLTFLGGEDVHVPGDGVAPPGDGHVQPVVAAHLGVGPAPPLLVGLQRGHALPVNHKVNWNKTNGLFNNALNTFYLRLYGVRHMVKDHSEREKCFI